MNKVTTIIFLLSSLISFSQGNQNCNSLLQKKLSLSINNNETQSDLIKLSECENIEQEDLQLLSLHIYKYITNPDATFAILLQDFYDFKKSNDYIIYIEMLEKLDLLSKTYFEKGNWTNNEKLMKEVGLTDLKNFKKYCKQKKDGSKYTYQELYSAFENEKEEKRNVEFNMEVTKKEKITSLSETCTIPTFHDYLYIPHGIKGYFDYTEGLDCSKEKKKPNLIYFTGHGSINSREFEYRVWSDSKILKLLSEDFVITVLYVDDKTKLPKHDQILSEITKDTLRTIGQKSEYYQKFLFSENKQPAFYIIDSKEKLLTEPYYFDLSISSYMKFLLRGIEKNNAL